MWWTIEKIKRENESSGHYFFSKGALRFFKSRISSYVRFDDNSVYFITSEKSPFSSRKYTVRVFDPKSYTVSNKSEFQQFQTLAQAKSYVNYLVK